MTDFQSSPEKKTGERKATGAQKLEATPESPPSNVKIYDRPASAGRSPAFIAVAVIVLIILVIFLYKMFVH